MPLRRRKIVYDTQVVSHAAAGRIPPDVWDRVSRFVSANCRYAISINTMYELLSAIAHGDDAHFLENRDRLKTLCPAYRRDFLPLVGDFVRARVLGEAPRRADFQPNRLRYWPEIVLKAKSRRELQSGEITLNRPGHSNKSYGLDLRLLARQIESGKRAHVEALEGLRSGKLLRPTPRTWAAALLGRIGVRVTPDSVEKVIVALDAVYQYDAFLWDLAQKQRYGFSDHDSDWLDSQQLYYLADPAVLLVTQDSRIGRRVARSSQRDRIISFESLCSLAAV